MNFQWESDTMRFAFVVDCQTLQGLACGHTALLSDELRPLISRIVRNIVSLVGTGRLPSCIWSDPIRWERRVRNKVADYLCNFTMDVKKCSWRELRNTNVRLDSNLLIFSDGGTRQECSASAWLLCAVCGSDTIPAAYQLFRR